MPNVDVMMAGPVHPLAARSPTLSESFAASLTTLAELEYGPGGVDDVLPWMLPMAHMPQMSNMSQMHGPARDFPSYAYESRHDTRHALLDPTVQALPLPPLPQFEVRDVHNNDTHSNDTHPAVAVPHLRTDKQHGQDVPRPSANRHGKPTQLPLSETQLPDVVQRLLHHYQTHVSQLMMPTSAPSHNPYLRLYLPMALHKPTTPSKECLLYAIVAVAAYNKAELSSVHDRDAYRQQALKYKEKADGMIRAGIAGCSHAGPRHLMESTDKQALLAAALTMTTVEVFSGANEGKGYEHILLCKQIIRLTGGLEWWMADTASLTLLQIFRCLEIIAYTSGWSCPPESKALTPDVDVSEEVVEPSPPVAEHDAGAADGGNDRSTGVSSGGGMGYPMASSMLPMAEYTLDVSFGVSMKTLHCLNKIIELAISKDGRSENKKTGHVWPSGAAQELRTLESEVFGIMADADAFQVPPPAPPQVPQTGTGPRQARQEDSGEGDADDGDDDDGASGDEDEAGFAQDGTGISAIVSEEIKVNHMWAFHYSTALFFRRALCNGQRSFKAADSTKASSSSTQLPSGQELVSKALEHLENVDALSSDIAIANTLWPGFIAAVEAVDKPLRHRALVWFARARRHGIGNIAKAKALVMEVWRRVDRQMAVGGAAGKKRKGTAQTELSRVDWRDVMREEGMYIMLT
ncbi:hypothetical protein SEUCBS139899_009583 [Sporothrix eucalyptigena]